MREGACPPRVRRRGEFSREWKGRNETLNVVSSTLLLPFGQYLLSSECGPRDVKEKQVNHQENGSDDEEVARVPEGDQIEFTTDINPSQRENHEGPELHRDPHIAHPGRDDNVPFDAHDCCERDHEEEDNSGVPSWERRRSPACPGSPD